MQPLRKKDDRQLAGARQAAGNVHGYFEEEASRYEGYFVDAPTGRSILFRTRLAIACDLAQGTAGSLLDCAAGTGEITAEILKSGRYSTATCVDISNEMLRRAKARLAGECSIQGVSFLQSDIFDFLRQEQGRPSFELILCLGLIAHTGRLDLLLRQLAGCLSFRGRVLLQTSLLDHPGHRLWRLLMHKRAARRHGYAFSYFWQRDIEAAARNAGLRIVAVKKYALGIPFADEIAPQANHCLEVKFRHWAERHGAEAVFALAKPGEELSPRR